MGDSKKVQEICELLECAGCGACATICPVSAISMVSDNEGFQMPIISQSLCVGCGRCLRTCPIANPIASKEGSFYMAWNLDSSVLEKCSSGGVFDALASYVFERDGIVFGARINQKTGLLEHVGIERAAEIDDLRRSKYYQSSVGKAYNEALQQLKHGRWVLFTGTSCQVAGLLSMVGETALREKLLTMDVLCHGVTSKRVVDSYIECKENRLKSKVEGISFRRKRGDLGWAAGCGPTTLILSSSNGELREWTDDGVDGAGTFFAGYTRSLFLRESCYRCKYCSTARVSDFTAADFWGVEKERVGDWQHWHGVSILLFNTGKALALMDEIKSLMHVEAITPQEAIPRNGAFVRPAARPKFRDRVFEELQTKDFDTVMLDYYNKEVRRIKLRAWLKRCLGNQVFAS